MVTMLMEMVAVIMEKITVIMKMVRMIMMSSLCKGRGQLWKVQQSNLVMRVRLAHTNCLAYFPAVFFIFVILDLS